MATGKALVSHSCVVESPRGLYARIIFLPFSETSAPIFETAIEQHLDSTALSLISIRELT